jgi:hypothetical protein
MFRSNFKTIFRGLVDSTLSSYQVEICWYKFVIELCGLRPQTAQFYNERILTDLKYVTWQSTVHEPPENGLKMGPKHVGVSF